MKRQLSLIWQLRVHELHKQFQKRLPEGCPIPSIQWRRLQFWPQNRAATTSKYVTGKLKLKYMVQSRQFQCFHVDAHMPLHCSDRKKNLPFAFGISQAFIAWMTNIHVKLVSHRVLQLP